MIGQPSARRRFQFRLRTLMIVVTLFCVASGSYIRWQASIVKERKRLLKRIVDLPGGYQHNDPPGEQFFIRRWLGDEPIVAIWFSSSAAGEEGERIRAAFPEAEFLDRDKYK